jgi:cytochrome c
VRSRKRTTVLIERTYERDLMPRKKILKLELRLLAAFGLSLLTTVLMCRDAYAQSSPVTIAASSGDPARGETLYQGCMDCHSIDKNDVGPMHRGVVGRHAGVIAGYGYSKALRNSSLTWDEPTLDRWLTNPGALVPGTRMFYEVQNPQDRADIIAFLKQQK